MDIYDLTINQLKRAAAIREQIEKLNQELGSIVSVSAKYGAASTTRRTVSASTKKKIAAAQKARWIQIRQAKPATRSGRPTAQGRKKTFSPATRAKLSAKLKAYWAATKAGKKTPAARPGTGWGGPRVRKE